MEVTNKCSFTTKTSSFTFQVSIFYRIRIILRFHYNIQLQTENNCNVKPINESGEIIFGFILESAGYNMKPPNNLFHFNNGQSFIKINQTEWRGIKVNHYQSCQSWTEINTIATVNYYFKVPEHQQAVIYDDLFSEIPIAMVVEGYESSGIPNVKPEKVKLEYNFYEFRTAIERRADLFSVIKKIILISY